MVAKGRVTMAQVAEHSGVSLSTVSLVLRDRPGVGSGTRRRVLKAAKDLGYIAKKPPTKAAAHLTSIGLILKAERGRVPEANRFYSRVVAGIETACRRLGANLLYASMTVDEDSHPLELPRVLLEQDSVDGLLLVGVFVNEALNPVVDRRTTPIVLVDAYATSTVHDAVVSDNTEGAYLAVKYLIDNGHRHVAFVGSDPKAHPSIRERQSGYERALEAHSVSDRYYGECHIVNSQETVAATSELLRSSPEITAVFGVNDEAAIAVMKDPAFRPEGEVILASGGRGVLSSDDDSEDRVEILSYEPERIVISANLAEEGYLVLTDAYYPGWRALTDGLETPIYRADLLFRAVYLPAGQHRVEFVYDPRSFKMGVAISLTALLGLVAGVAVLAGRRERDGV